MKQIVAIESTLEARRLLRSIRIEIEKTRKELNRMSVQNIKACKGVRISKEKRLLAESLLKATKCNIKLVSHIHNLLKTHLYEHSNLNNKLQRQAQMLNNESNDLQHDLEHMVAGQIPSTRTDDPLGVILSDLHKRLSKHPNTVVSEPTVFSQTEETFGILNVSSNHTMDKLFIVVTVVEGKNKFKTFLNDIPIEHSSSDMTEFLSPSLLYKQLVDILTVDKILRS